jgi:hypothetical protein
VSEAGFESSQEASGGAQIARLRQALTHHASFSRAQALVGLLAGLISICGALFSYLRPLAPPLSTTGEVVALVQVAHSMRPLTGAQIEVLTPKDTAIVTTLVTENGRARQALKEGIYRLRVTYPRFEPQVRQVLVIGGQTARIRIGLTPHPEEEKRTFSAGFGAIRRVFQQ